MKTFFLILCLFFGIIQSYSAQETEVINKKSAIGISTTFWGGNSVVFQQLKEAPSYDGEGFYTVEINYMYSFNKVLDLETGFGYGEYNFTVYPGFHTLPPPDVGNSPRSSKYSLFYIPISLRVNFWKYFFVNGGVEFDFEADDNYFSNNQTGMGIILGVGFKYDFKMGLSLFLNPYYKIHKVISFSEGSYYGCLTEGGLRIGAMFKF